MHFFEGPGLAQQLGMRGHSVAIGYRFQGCKNMEKEATHIPSCVYPSICFNGFFTIFLKDVLIYGLLIYHKSLFDSDFEYAVHCFRHLPPKHRNIEILTGMAPTEKSPGRLVGKINWRINEAPV